MDWIMTGNKLHCRKKNNTLSNKICSQNIKEFKSLLILKNPMVSPHLPISPWRWWTAGPESQPQTQVKLRGRRCHRLIFMVWYTFKETNTEKKTDFFCSTFRIVILAYIKRRRQGRRRKGRTIRSCQIWTRSGQRRSSVTVPAIKPRGCGFLWGLASQWKALWGLHSSHGNLSNTHGGGVPFLPLSPSCLNWG